MATDETKLGTEFNIALATPYEERERSLDLNVGYDRLMNEWELIVRHTGSLEDISSEIGFNYQELLNGFAIIRIESGRIGQLSMSPQIIFIEKPKQLYAERTGRITGFTQSCMEAVQSRYLNLTGKGVLVAVIDSGIDFRHPDFIREDNTTRIYELWDQSIPGNPPQGYTLGSVYTKDDINSLLSENGSAVREEEQRAVPYIPSADITGHGTGVASVVSACAPDAELLIIKLNDTEEGGFPRTTALMLAIDYAVRTSMSRAVPMVINLSFGNNYGDHDGNSVLEEYIDSVARLSRLTFAVGMGNDGNTGRHAQITLEPSVTANTEFQVYPYTTGINIQIWKSYLDSVDISLVTPAGQLLGPFNLYQEVMRYRLNDMEVLVINGSPTPVNSKQETYISVIPRSDYIQEGIWNIRFVPRTVSDGRVDAWLPVAGSTSAQIRFTRPTASTTVTIPSTAQNIVSVGAYNPFTLGYAAFSGRGYTVNGLVKPDISAPGVNIDVAVPGGGYMPVSGTSFATPFVSAGAAMLMQWGIVDGNDPYLYGDKLKAYLIRGAVKLPGYMSWPNERLGWGALCVENSIPS